VSEGWLEIVGLEVNQVVVENGAHSESWRKRIPDCKSCNAETAGGCQINCGHIGWRADWYFTT